MLEWKRSFSKRLSENGSRRPCFFLRGKALIDLPQTRSVRTMKSPTARRPNMGIITGASSYQIPAIARLEIEEPPTLDPSVHPYYIQGNRIYQPKIVKQKTRNNPDAPRTLLILNDRVRVNQNKIEKTLSQLHKLEANFTRQACITTTISAIFLSILGAAALGAFKGVSAGPKGAMIGSMIGAGSNLADIFRRKQKNKVTQRTLSFIHNVIHIYFRASSGRFTVKKIFDEIVTLHQEAKVLGPAAQAVFAELEMLLLLDQDPSVEKMMREFHKNRVYDHMAENRS